MNLIHVSSYISNRSFKYKKFTPRVPNLRDKNEDSNINRVCFSNDIRKCLNAMPEGDDYGYYITRGLEKKTLGYGSKGQIQDRFRIPAIFDVFEIDTKNIDNSNIITPIELKEKGLVMDSLENSEYWLLGEPINLLRTKTIRYIDISPELANSCSKDRDLIYTDILIENNVEDFERYYKYAFINGHGVGDMNKLLNDLGMTDIKEDVIYYKNDFKITLISFTAPAYTDMEKVWRFYFHLSIKDISKLSLNKQDILSNILNKI